MMLHWSDVDIERPPIAEWCLCICSKKSHWLAFRANGGWYVNTNYGQLWCPNEGESKIEIKYWMLLPKLPRMMKEFDHIPTDEIQQDIEATKLEITDYEDEEMILMRNPTENKVRLYFISGNLIKRKEFIKKLESILIYRELTTNEKENPRR